jgi:hypothetical protein
MKIISFIDKKEIPPVHTSLSKHSVSVLAARSDVLLSALSSDSLLIERRGDAVDVVVEVGGKRGAEVVELNLLGVDLEM